jgi:triphosphoribosyl-dephospho-CoA synthase
MTSADAVAEAFLAACRAELKALKPGNVHVHAAGHGMTVADFEASALAAAPYVARPRLAVGERILGAVEATRAAVGQNTNLGIILLAAPLAAAAEHAAGRGLRASLRGVLAGLTRTDAALCFRAIALANPGGLGEAPEHDVRAPASTTLLDAMRLAAGRDRIAAQYATDYADIFNAGLPAAADPDLTVAAERVYWRLLRAMPDSHVARKHGARKAEAVRRLARLTERRLQAVAGSQDRPAVLLALDAVLKRRGLNPGATADLTVATLFARGLLFHIAET